MRKAVFLDRDGVINRTIFRDGKPRAPDTVEDFEFFPGVEMAVARLRAAGFLIVVVTNQPDVARGWQKRENVDAMNAIVRERLAVDCLKACFHLDAEGCLCRKPLPGMLHEAATELGIDLSSSFMVGDRLGDIEAGRAAGCRGNLFILSEYRVSGEDAAIFKPDGIFGSLPEAAEWILRTDPN
jgi:D-glycero-D-manno-heptose 1,7-bisphosphate phosphatase